ncbi:hypothetical protein [Gynuella sunshinyii]|uniref:Uncharacterized protein n=1 Tax=Gynuella sunshinyii YC6258 TaxID=1445510 RepID=A0A0C5VRV7_9GAMM|nr:hypothetical protein [Gynuella sunshinyii]AJQ93004.1 hypothetical Protein YC6258_00954 [Gynuella sunshinyii YC6258]
MTLRTFLLGLMLTIGWLGAVFTGGCTLFFAIGSISDGTISQRYVPWILMIGGVPFILSVLLIWLVKHISRRGQSNDQPGS